MSKYEVGNLYQTTSNKGGGKKAKGEKPDMGRLAPIGPNTKKTGSLVGQPLAKQSKKSITPNFSDQ
jgi:hypothetical protein